MSCTTTVSPLAPLTLALVLLGAPPAASAAAPVRSASPSSADGAPAAIAELPGLGGFDLVAFVKGEEPGCFVLQTPSSDLALVAFQADAGPTQPWHVAIRLTKPASFSLARLVPRLDGRILGDPGLAECELVSSRSRGKVALAKFPEAMRAALSGFDEGSGSIELKEGVNLYVALGARSRSRCPRPRPSRSPSRVTRTSSTW